MKLTIEMDPTADKDAFDRVMAALTGAAQTTNKASTAEAPVGTPEVTTPDEKPEETPSSEKPRVYGEAGAGRKRRTKVEMAEDEEIEDLAAKTELAISTDIPAAQMLAELKEAAAENTPDEKPDETPSDEKSDEEGFQLDEEEEDMSPEEFRGKVIALNKEHGKAAIAVLSEYGSGLSKIPKEKYKEVLSRLQDLGNA